MSTFVTRNLLKQLSNAQLLHYQAGVKCFELLRKCLHGGLEVSLSSVGRLDISRRKRCGADGCSCLLTDSFVVLAEHG